MKNLLIMFCLLVALSAYPLQQQPRTMGMKPGIALPSAGIAPVEMQNAEIQNALYHYIGQPAKNFYTPFLSNGSVNNNSK